MKQTFRTLFLAHFLAIFLAFVAFAPTLSSAATTGYSDSVENTITDCFRGQACAPFPATHYYGLTTDTCSDAGPGTEPSGNGYARVAVVASLANFAGTQGSGTTVASSGTGGATSNNGAITFPTSTGAWASGATLQAVRTYTLSSGGVQTTCIDLTTGFAVPATGVTLSFPAAAWSLTIN